MIGLRHFSAIGRFALVAAITAPVTVPQAWAGHDEEAPLRDSTAVVQPTEESRSDTLRGIEELAAARWRQGALTEAATLRRGALRIAFAASGCESVEAAAAMAALAAVEIDRRRYLDAEPLLIVAKRLLQGRDAIGAPVMATIVAGLARIALARGDKEAAAVMASRAVEIARRDPQARSAEPWRALAAALTAVERFDEAEVAIDAALALDRKYQDDTVEMARSLAQRANLELRRGRPEQALPLIEQAMLIDQDRLSPTHPFIADDLFDLGIAYDALKRPELARQAFLAATTLLERGDGRETPRFAYAETELSRIYREQGDEAAADIAAKDARRILYKAETEARKREREV